MFFLYPFVALFIFIRNPFSSKKYSASLIGSVVLICRSNPEIVIRDYHFYIQSLLARHLRGFKRNKAIFFECPGLRPLKLLLPSINILLQIEHTLFKPGSQVSSGGIPGNLVVPQSTEKYLIRIADLEKLNTANIIFDYSRINLFNIQSSPLLKDFLKKSFCISPALYPLFTQRNGRSGIITLFGNPEASRRKIFLESLDGNGVKTKNIRGVYFGVDEIYRTTKIVINIRQTDGHDTLEELRVLPALRSGAIVVSETAPYVEKTAYAKFVIWGSLDELPGLVDYVEKNYDAVYAQIFGDGSENSSFMKRMKRIERCNELSMKRAVKLMNSLR